MSNIHSKQTGNQLHYPRRYKEAHDETILCKSDDTYQKFLGSSELKEITLTPVADSSGSLNNKYFYIYTRNCTQKIAMYFNVNNAGTLTIADVDNLTDRLIEITLNTNDTVATIVDQIKAKVESIHSTAHQLYSSSVDGTSAYVVQNFNTKDWEVGNTGFSVSVETSPYDKDEFIIATANTGVLAMTDAKEYIADTIGDMVTGNTETNVAVTYDDSDNTLDFNVSLDGAPLTTEEVQDIVGAMFTGNTETNITATYQDADGTIDLVVAGETGDISSVTITADTGEHAGAEGAYSIVIAGGTNISTSITDGTLTISETTEKKTKSDIDTLTGTTETNLGEFTGSTIPNSRDIKTAIQDLETKAETEATTSVKGIASFNTSDFTVTSGAVSSKKFAIISETYRYEAQNLVPVATSFYGWNNEQHNKSGKVETELGENLNDLTTNYGLWSTVYIRPNMTGTFTFQDMSAIMSGTNGAVVKLNLYKFSPNGETANYGNGTLISTTSHTLTGNDNPVMATGSNAEESETLVLASLDVLMFVLTVEEDLEDLDCRGSFSFNIERAY
ncbi:MAG: hypothetical protein Unbinned2716contig1000_52 [Prokaryotic dsDNA virus sp.]|nr:MAG: hypothetical protein Unbinned2716contig1000_52 [Prokaryotic dsDNA virus sp.]|tara:strand:+ start:2798 stop:4477 length:1680 start_codon:yes stop_codon:yes gene_type:complete